MGENGNGKGKRFISKPSEHFNFSISTTIPPPSSYVKPQHIFSPVPSPPSSLSPSPPPEPDSSSLSPLSQLQSLSTTLTPSLSSSKPSVKSVSSISTARPRPHQEPPQPSTSSTSRPVAEPLPLTIKVEREDTPSPESCASERAENALEAPLPGSVLPSVKVELLENPIQSPSSKSIPSQLKPGSNKVAIKNATSSSSGSFSPKVISSFSLAPFLPTSATPISSKSSTPISSKSSKPFSSKSSTSISSKSSAPFSSKSLTPFLPPSSGVFSSSLSAPVSLSALSLAPSSDVITKKSSTSSGSFKTQYKVIPCKVCGGESAGVHFGVLTCEGCKGFFRRILLSKTKLECSAYMKCRVDAANRTRCQYCRFQKCLDAGMSRNGIQLGRRSKKMKGEIEEEARYHRDRVQMEDSNSSNSVDVINTDSSGCDRDQPIFPLSDQNQHQSEVNDNVPRPSSTATTISLPRGSGPDQISQALLHHILKDATKVTFVNCSFDKVPQS